MVNRFGNGDGDAWTRARGHGDKVITKHTTPGRPTRSESPAAEWMAVANDRELRLRFDVQTSHRNDTLVPVRQRRDPAASHREARRHAASAAAPSDRGGLQPRLFASTDRTLVDEHHAVQRRRGAHL